MEKTSYVVCFFTAHLSLASCRVAGPLPYFPLPSPGLSFHAFQTPDRPPQASPPCLDPHPDLLPLALILRTFAFLFSTILFLDTYRGTDPLHSKIILSICLSLELILSLAFLLPVLSPFERGATG